MHGLGKRRVRHLQRQMHMIAHQAKPVHAIPEAGRPLLEQAIAVVAVFIGKKDVLAVVTPHDDVVDTPGDMHAGLSGHGGTLTFRRFTHWV